MNISQQIRTTFKNLQRLHPNKASDLKATVQLVLLGQDGGDFVLRIDKGQFTTEAGRTNTPDITLTMAAEDYLSIMRGEADPMKMVMSGQIGLEGDRSLAMRVQSILLDH